MTNKPKLNENTLAVLRCLYDKGVRYPLYGTTLRERSGLNIYQFRTALKSLIKLKYVGPGGMQYHITEAGISALLKENFEGKARSLFKGGEK